MEYDDHGVVGLTHDHGVVLTHDHGIVLTHDHVVCSK